IPPNNAKPAPKLKAANALQAPMAAQLAQIQVQQVQPAQIQIQVQPNGQVQILQNGQVARSGAPSGIVVQPGTPKNEHVSYAGAVRSRLVAGPKRDGEYVLVLEASAEPRLQGFGIVGNPAIDRALDDQGQALTMNLEPLPQNPAEV